MANPSQEVMDAEERKIAKSIGDSYCGIARIDLKNLNFDASTRDISQANVMRLKGILEQNCSRLQAGHRVPGILSQSLLDDCLRRSQLSRENLLSVDDPPKMQVPSGISIQCLHGQHRIAAAFQVLDPGDDWWTVELYLDSKSYC